MSALILALVVGFSPSSCTVNGKHLAGRMRVVGWGADVKVRRVTSMPDLRVVWRGSMASRCGEWTRVSSGEDFTVQIVPSGEDLKVQFVGSFPGPA